MKIPAAKRRRLLSKQTPSSVEIAGNFPNVKPEAARTLYRCKQCFLTRKPDDMKPAAAFGVAAPQEITSQILEDGAWTRCLPCREEANLKRRRAGLPDIRADSSRVSERVCEEDAGLQCTKCGTTRPCGFYSATSIRNILRNKTLVCNVCQELQKCDRCMLWQKLSAFRTAQGTRLDTCKQCMAIRCSGCGETKNTDQFTRQNLLHCLTHSQNVCCNACIAEGKTPKSGGTRLNA